MLIRHELRKFITPRKSGVLLILIGILLCVVCRDLKISGYNDYSLAMLSFTAFHIYLLCGIPWLTWRSMREPDMLQHVEALRLTPIPDSAILRSLWLRCLLRGGVPLLVFYFPLWIVYDWLYADPMYGGGGSDISRVNRIIITAWEFLADLAIVGLVALPFVRRRFARRILMAAGILFLFVLPRATDLITARLLPYFNLYPILEINGQEWHFPEFAYTSHARLHPIITLSYFFVTAAFSAALGVHCGLRYRSGDRAVVGMILCGLIMEVAAWHIAAGHTSFTSVGEIWGGLEDFQFLLHMLNFYSLSFGALWMCIKWNLVFLLLRKPIPVG